MVRLLRGGTRVDINPKKFRRRLVSEIERNMRATTVFVRDEVKKKLNRGQPTRTLPSGSIIGLDPSKPGEPPKKITSQLQNSITTRVTTTRREIIGEVGTPLKKGFWLEFGTRQMAARPYLRPTIAENKRKIGRGVVKGLRAL